MSLLDLTLVGVYLISHHWVTSVEGLILMQLLTRNFKLWFDVLFQDICETFGKNELVFPKLDDSLKGVHDVKIVLLGTKDAFR